MWISTWHWSGCTTVHGAIWCARLGLWSSLRWSRSTWIQQVIVEELYFIAHSVHLVFVLIQDVLANVLFTLGGSHI